MMKKGKKIQSAASDLCPVDPCFNESGRAADTLEHPFFQRVYQQLLSNVDCR